MRGKRVLLGITGGIACYKTLDLVKKLKKLKEKLAGNKTGKQGLKELKEVIEKIENIQRKSIAQVTNSQSKSEETENINELKEELSTELKLSLESRKNKATSVQIAEEVRENGHLLLSGFVDEHWSSARDAEKLKISEILNIKIADVEGRIATLAAYDANGDFVGSFFNNYGNTYDEFTRAVCVAAGSSCFEGKVTEISNNTEDDKELGISMCFTLSVTPKTKQVERL